MSSSASLIICTANRPQSLRETLEVLCAVRIPPGMDFELLVVDNAPASLPSEQSQTALVVNGLAANAPFPIRYVPETMPGLSNARNRGMAEARGNLILMTDDDIRPEADWLTRMTAPLTAGTADAVAGGVRLAPYLLRPWMTAAHKVLLASTEWKPSSESVNAMIGANMAFDRRILEKVPLFDVELGAGTPFGGEEILFSYQFIEAGFRLSSQLDVVVEHHAEESRLARAALVSRMARSGREAAYIRYHWEQEPVGEVRRNAIRSLIEMWQAARAAKRGWPHDEGLPAEELKSVELHYFYRQYMIERRRPRNYDRRGLVKKRGVLAPASESSLLGRLPIGVEEGSNRAHRH